MWSRTAGSERRSHNQPLLPDHGPAALWNVSFSTPRSSDAITGRPRMWRFLREKTVDRIRVVKGACNFEVDLFDIGYRKLAL